jgi:hypothetical protein
VSKKKKTDETKLLEDNHNNSNASWEETSESGSGVVIDAVAVICICL